MAMLVSGMVLHVSAVASDVEAGDDTATTNIVRRATPIADLRTTGIGDRLADPSLTDLQGTTRTLAERLAPHRAVVMAMRDVTCPIAMKYGPRLAALESELAADNVAFIYVNFSEHDSPAAMADEARRYGLRGAYIHDLGQVIRNLLRPKTTTEVFVIDASRTLRYRGAIDDQYGVGYQTSQPSHSYLRVAVDAVLSNRQVSIPATTAPGCAVELPEFVASSPPASFTWHNDISRIVQRKCLSCHRPGGGAPFSLEQYESVRGRKAMIAHVVAEGLMPPWSAAVVPDHQQSPWSNDMSLAMRERRMILDWIAGGCEEGNSADAPLPLVWPGPDEWTIGQPDFVTQIPTPVTVPAEGVLDYQIAFARTDFTEDRWIRAMEIRPTAPDVVHHVLVFLEEPQRSGESDRDYARRVENGLNGHFARMAPGANAAILPPGRAKRLPAGAWLKFQIHYTPNGTPASDQTRLAFQFDDAPPMHEVQTSAIVNTRIRIPPGASDHRMSASMLFDQPTLILGLTPHMHLRGKSFRYDLEYPDGRRRVICDVPRFQFDWQFGYMLAEPLEVPAGARLHAVGWYDNSADNPANPDPTRTVKWGPQVWDEMFIGYFDWTR